MQAAEQGSGVLLSTHLILTCEHVLRDAKEVRVVSPEAGKPVDCEVLWSDARLDAALLLASHPPAPASPERLERIRLGIPAEDGVPCMAMGFPLAMRDQGRLRRDAEQGTALISTYMPGTRPRMDLKLGSPAAADREDLRNPLAGFSGGPVFVGDVLAGHTVELPDGRHNTRVVFVPVPEVLKDEAARAAWQEHAGPVPSVETVLVNSRDDQTYETQYKAEVRRKFRTRGVIGLEIEGPGAEHLDLDPSYVVLRAKEGRQLDNADETSPRKEQDKDNTPQGVHALLATHSKVLLTGKAGSGKTTLISWIARSCTSPEPDECLDELRSRIPLVVKLREVHARGLTLPSVDRLHEELGSAAPQPPQNWARRVLDDSRGILLIDGLDEIPSAERERVRQELDRWLDGRDVRCVVTSRPGAFSSKWQNESGYTELSFEDMDTDEIEKFVTHWYQAAHRIHRHLGDWSVAADDLTRQIAGSTELRDLARSPLLCAALCALHRAEKRELPTRLWDLLDRTLAMLLGRRDLDRTITSPEGVPLDEAQHRDYLKPIAAWMVRGGQQVINEQQALCQIRLAGGGSHSKWSNSEVLEQLVRRTILRVPAKLDSTYEFVHRTFQDFLAAGEIAGTENVSELLRNAEDNTWREVIKLSPGHWQQQPALQHQLLEGLLKRGDEQEGEDSADVRAELHMLAAACAFNCNSLDSDIAGRVGRALKGLLPPSSNVPSSVGSLGLPLIEYIQAAPSSLSAESADDLAVIVGDVGGATAIPLASQLAALGLPGVGSRLAEAWRAFPTTRFAEDVLAGADLSDASLSIYSVAELKESARLRPVREIWIRKELPHELLLEHLTPGFSELDFLHPELTDLSFLAEHSEALEVLWIREPSAASDLSPLAHCGKVRELHVEGGSTVNPSFLRQMPALQHLDFDRPTGEESVLQQLVRPSRLESLSILMSDTSSLGTANPFPVLRRLQLRGVENWTDLSPIAALFPYLDNLILIVRPGRSDVLDLSPLHAMTELRVTIHRRFVPALQIRGHEPFGRRLRCYPRHDAPSHGSG
ncbi:NACHT domain-containing protein [[Kitasatospora] papulosa]|uniref:NACHT domain-containing protein n=1 Tax=[Kitasatospora] papulosa TaxID=1464011 RepID=UPI0036B3F8E0